MTTAETLRAYRGPPLFSFGFRPFFLGASIWAAFAVLIWVASLALGHAGVGGRPGLVWHIDEMLFGFLPAVFAGFLLTAVPNWTGRLPVSGAPLALLFGLWAAGRLAGLFAGDIGLAAPSIDLAFLLVFSGLIWREILAAKNMRNLPVCIMVSALALAHIAFHLRDVAPLVGDIPQRAALAVAAGMIALIGGRIVPSFTRNWLAAQGRPATASAAPALLDKIGLAFVGLAIIGWVAAPAVPVVGAALVMAGLATLVRLSRWHGFSAWREPLVWILHAGYCWLGLALVAIGAGALAPDLIPPSAGIHALTTGAVGVMTLAVMTRASLGHTGRALSANRSTLAIYCLANLAAVLRFAAPFDPDLHIPLLVASAATWALAFGGFALAYGPLLLTPRVQAKRA